MDDQQASLFIFVLTTALHGPLTQLYRRSKGTRSLFIICNYTHTDIGVLLLVLDLLL
ncbi:hypothetical protein BDR03DRAFT_972039 [Suillus americanus]|nr:hypothetical protein BDR03DRAFT_972039 [Suillus americanus]